MLGGYGGTVRKLMLTAHRLGLIRAGYAFISYEVLLTSCKQSKNSTEDAIACATYEGLLDISLYVPSNAEYENFTTEVRRRMAEPPFNRPMKANEQVSCFLSLRFQNFAEMQISDVEKKIGSEISSDQGDLILNSCIWVYISQSYSAIFDDFII